MADPCAICGLPDTRDAKLGEPNCIIRGGDRCYRLGFARLQAALQSLQVRLSDRAETLRKELSGGAIVVHLEAARNLTKEEEGLQLMREQVVALRQVADKLDAIAGNWAADLEAGRYRHTTGGKRG